MCWNLWRFFFTYVVPKHVILWSSTAAATFRQAVALIFGHVVSAESLPSGKMGSGNQFSRTSSVTDDVSRSINHSVYVFVPCMHPHMHTSVNIFTSCLSCITQANSSIHRSLDSGFVSGGPSSMRADLTKTGKLGLRLLEDLTALAAGGSVCVK